MKTRMRKAIAEDLAVLNQISVESKKYWGYPEEWIQRWLSDLTVGESDLKQNETYVLTLGDGLAGFCSIAEEAHYYEIIHLWVLPAYIGKGHGKRLLNESIANTVHSHKKIKVVADPNAENFYKSQGFTTVRRIESFPKGRYLPVMEKQH